MFRLSVRTISLMISTVLMGILVGGIVYSHIAFFPSYMSGLPNSAVLVNGPYPINDGLFWVLIHPLAILSLIVALALNWKVRPRRKLIAITLIIYVVSMIATTLYFVPELMAFKASPTSGISAPEWYARGQRWQHLSWLRGTVMGLGYISLLLALVAREDNTN